VSRGNPFLALRVPSEMMELLREVSARQGRGTSDVAREALAKGLLSDPATACVGAALGRGLHHGAESTPRPRRESRIQRTSSATDVIRQLLNEYEDWQSRLPEFAEQSATAEKLELTIEALGNALEILEDLDLPRGYGRD
jgi:hypothetical protein